MSAAYQKLRMQYHAAAKAASQGDAAAKADKAKMMNEIRSMERESAREGRVLVPTLTASGQVNVQTVEGPSKRSLQEEYIRKFDAEKVVKLNGKETTLREFHSRRLLGR